MAYIDILDICLGSRSDQNMLRQIPATHWHPASVHFLVNDFMRTASRRSDILVSKTDETLE